MTSQKDCMFCCNVGQVCSSEVERHSKKILFVPSTPTATARFFAGTFISILHDSAVPNYIPNYI